MIKSSESSLPNRRAFLRRAGLASAVAAIAPAAASLLSGTRTARAADDMTDVDAAVLTFALNLEYLEAEFYSYAFFGDSITNHGAGIDGTGTPGDTVVKANSKVPFANPLVEQYAREIAQDEINHVIFLRAALNDAGITPIAKPAIDLLNSFNTAAKVAGIADTFDPFSNDTAFLLGSFVFEDVGVTAYHGAAGLITNKGYLGAAAGILAVEAYHAGIIRTTLYALNEQAGDNSIAQTVEKISSLRDALDGARDKDQGIIDADGNANLVPTNGASIVYGRSTRKVLNIVYGGVDASKGLFFPGGFNGAIK